MRWLITALRRLGRSALRAKWARQDRELAVELALLDPLIQKAGKTAALRRYYVRRAQDAGYEIVCVNDHSTGRK